VKRVRGEDYTFSPSIPIVDASSQGSLKCFFFPLLIVSILADNVYVRKIVGTFLEKGDEEVVGRVLDILNVKSCLRELHLCYCPQLVEKLCTVAMKFYPPSDSFRSLLKASNILKNLAYLPQNIELLAREESVLRFLLYSLSLVFSDFDGEEELEMVVENNLQSYCSFTFYSF